MSAHTPAQAALLEFLASREATGKAYTALRARGFHPTDEAVHTVVNQVAITLSATLASEPDADPRSVGARATAWIKRTAMAWPHLAVAPRWRRAPFEVVSTPDEAAWERVVGGHGDEALDDLLSIENAAAVARRKVVPQSRATEVCAAGFILAARELGAVSGCGPGEDEALVLLARASPTRLDEVAALFGSSRSNLEPRMRKNLERARRDVRSLLAASEDRDSVT